MTLSKEAFVDRYLNDKKLKGKIKAREYAGYVDEAHSRCKVRGNEIFKKHRKSN